MKPYQHSHEIWGQMIDRKFSHKNFFNFVKIKKRGKFDEILSIFFISDFCNFSRRNFKQTVL